MLDISGISVIITTYRRFETAKRAIESVLSQTYPVTELIVVEDSGDDELSDWVNSLNRREIVYFKNPVNSGLAVSRNIGLRFAKYDLVAYIDDDDIWLPEKLECQIKIIRQLSENSLATFGCVQVGLKILSEKGDVLAIGLPVNEGNLKKSIMEKGVHTLSSCFLFSRKALLTIGGFDVKLGSGIDDDIWMALAQKEYHNYPIHKALVLIYKNGRESMMSSTKKRISGIENYMIKWEPVYAEWFGEKRGKYLASKYFITAIGSLASEKIANGFFSEAFFAIKKVFNKSNYDVRLIAFTLYYLTRTCLANLLPVLGTLKRFANGKSKL